MYQSLLLYNIFISLIIQLLLHLFFVPAWLGQVEHLSEVKGILHQNLEF